MTTLTPPLIPSKPRVARDRRQRSDELLIRRLEHRQAERRKFRDRRGVPRVALEVPIEEKIGDVRYIRLSNDLSTFGLSTQQGESPPLGTTLSLLLRLPDSPQVPLRISGVVIGPFDDEGGMRVKFVHQSVQSAQRIHRYLSKLIRN